MPRKKQIHEAQTDLLPAEKKEIPADDVRLFLKNLTLHNMQSLKTKIATATIKEHEIIQNAINAAFKGGGLESANGAGVNITNNQALNLTGLSDAELDRIINGG
jgi:hypothetical protein